MTFADRVLKFISQLHIPVPLPPGFAVLNPFEDEYVASLCSRFYHQYYNDNNPRTFIIGINPGRHGGGTTGIPFTDPAKLQDYCGIDNVLHKKTELSADFMYQMMMQYGGVEKFYRRFYFTAVSPLGFTCAGKNANYYDNRMLQNSLTDFIVACMHTQLQFGATREVAYCVGEGTNYVFLKTLNDQHHFFKTIIPLPHPRFIMQYRRRQVDEYVKMYVRALEERGL